MQVNCKVRLILVFRVCVHGESIVIQTDKQERQKRNKNDQLVQMGTPEMTEVGRAEGREGKSRAPSNVQREEYEDAILRLLFILCNYRKVSIVIGTDSWIQNNF